LPSLQHVQGLLAWGRWNFESMATSMAAAEAGYLAEGDTDRARLALGYHAVALNALGRIDQSDTRLASLRRESLSTETRLVVLLACLWNALDLGRQDSVGPLLDEMLDLLETSDDQALWYRGHPLPRLNGMPGTARALERYVAGALRLTAETPTPLRALALSQRAMSELWTGHFDAASASLAAARADSLWLGEPPNVRGILQLIETVHATLSGRREAALDAARLMLAEHPRQRGPWSWATHLYYAARTAGAVGDLRTLRSDLLELETLRGRFSAPLGQGLLLLVGQHAWLEDDRARALQAWTEAVAGETLFDRLGSAIECRLRLAAALLADGDDDAVRRTLAPAAARVADDAGIGGVLYARSALTALADAAAQGRLGVDLGRIVLAWQALAAAGEAPPAAPKHVAVAPTASLEGLSSREREVLARIAAGDSNKLIARAFDLSPHTVKRHVANILDKLDLRSRGQAAAWYREHLK
jgi:LuxR family transcriptional regulator, maltose regulon positive regulatory protein